MMHNLMKPLRHLSAFILLATAASLIAYGGWTLALPSDQIPFKELRLFSDIYKQIKKHYVEEVADTILFDGAVKGMLEASHPKGSTQTVTEDHEYLQRMQAAGADNGSVLPLQKLRLLSNLYGELSHQTNAVEGEKLFEGAIHGMLAELDPYSTYLKARAYQNLKIGTDGKFGGLGIVVGKKDGAVRVMEVINNTPAQRAGLMAQDLIIQIDDRVTEDLSLGDAVDMMRGKRGTDINLIIRREGLEEPFSVTLTRATIKRESVKYVMLDDNIAYIRISNFQLKTHVELKATLQKLQETSELNGLILDLRLNPGGILNEAVAVSDIFLQPDQLVVYTRGRHPGSKTEYKTQYRSQYPKLPLVVLIDRGSASASEIVTGALKDHKRAVIMGAKSFGKASVQTVLPIDKESALKLTTARYYTPDGHAIHDIGIDPDIVIETPQAETEKTGKKKASQKQDKNEPEASAEDSESSDHTEDSKESPWLSFEERVRKDPQIDSAADQLRVMIQTAKNS